MKAGTLELPCSDWSPPRVHTSPDWKQILHLLEDSANQALQLDGLFLFELGQDWEEAPFFTLRAATGKVSRETCVPLDEAALASLDRTCEVSLGTDTPGPTSNLEPLVSVVAQQGYMSALIAPIRHRERILGCLVGASSQRHDFTSGERSVFSLLASHVAVALENVRLRAETEFRLSEAMSIQAVSSALVEERSLDTILSIIIDEAVRLTNASDALVLLLEEDGDWFRVCARKGDDVAGLTSGRLSVKDSLNGLVVRTGQPLVSRDAMTDPRSNQARARRLNVYTVAIAPLKIRDRTMGTIAVHNRCEGYFSHADVDVLCSFANQAAIAIDNARLFNELLVAKDEIQEKAHKLQELLVQTMSIQEDERRRIAADIHDRLVPLIVGALYEVQAYAGPQQSPEVHQKQIELIQELLNDAIEKTRTAIYDLWPATLDQIGLIPALQELISRQERTSGLQHRLRVHGAPYELSPSADIAVYRIVQGALANICQHANATLADILIRFSPRGVRIVIHDDGKGFEVQNVMLSPPGCNFGLINMRERALSIGGTLHVDSVPGWGTWVTLELPLEEQFPGTD